MVSSVRPILAPSSIINQNNFVMSLLVTNPYTNEYARQIFDVLQVHYAKYKIDARIISKVARILNDFCHEIDNMDDEERKVKERVMQQDCMFVINCALNIG